MLIYVQSTGDLLSDTGALWGRGYSGRGEGLNNPAAQHIRAVGPIPIGLYVMSPAFDHAMLGPVAIPLAPDPKNNMLGRSAFYIHGDNSKRDNTASHGCIIMGPVVRRRIAKLEDRTLKVVATPDMALALGS